MRVLKMDKSRNRITRAIYVPLSLILPLITLVLALYLLSGAAEAKSDMPTQQSIANDQASSNQPVNLPFAPNRLIIKLRSEALLNFRSGRAPSIDRLMNENRCLYIRPLFPSQSSLKKLNAPDLSPIQLIELETGGDVLTTVKAFSEDPNVEWAEPDYLAHAAAIPNDPLYPGQWALSHIHAPEAWDIVTGTPSVVIAVLDTGIDVDHPDLINRLWINPGETPGNDIDDDNNGYIDDVHGWNFIARNNEVDDDDGHGTKVAGVAAAEGNNAIGFSGICWNCRIMPVKVMQAGGVANYSDVALGVYYAAAKGAEVINLSLGGYANSKSLQSAIEAASQTSLIVAAAGDGNTNTPFYPAAYPQVLAVGGTTESDDRESSSNYGDWVDVAAPAVNITTTQNGGSYVSASGTSFAAPIVSGLAGLVRSQHPDWTSSMVQAQIIHTTDSIPASDLGSGRINALNAVTTSPHPMFEIDTTTINKDPLGRPEPGQDATLSVGLHNDWLDASSVTGTLTTSDSYVTIITGTASYGNIASGYSTSGSPMFVFNIASGAGYNHPIPFTLGLTSDGGIYTTTLPLTITTRSSDQNVSGTIMTNTTWTNDNTYIVVNNVGVAPGVTLTIKAGTMVKFNGNYNLNVGGTLVADGTETQPIRFMSNISSTWGKIYFDNPSTDAIADASGNYLGGNILHWVQVDDASEGIACNSATPYISHMTLTNGSVNCTRGDTIVWIQDSIIIGPGTDSTNNRGIVIGGTGYLIRNQVGGDGHRTWIKVGTASWLKENKVINGYVEAGTSSTIISNTVTNGIRFGGLIQGNIIGSGSCTSGIFGSNNTIIKKNITSHLTVL
jgi:subtilisin family serine protease